MRVSNISSLTVTILELDWKPHCVMIISEKPYALFTRTLAFINFIEYYEFGTVKAGCLRPKKGGGTMTLYEKLSLLIAVLSLIVTIMK